MGRDVVFDYADAAGGANGTGAPLALQQTLVASIDQQQWEQLVNLASGGGGGGSAGGGTTGRRRLLRALRQLLPAATAAAGSSSGLGAAGNEQQQQQQRWRRRLQQQQQAAAATDGSSGSEGGVVGKEAVGGWVSCPSPCMYKVGGWGVCICVCVGGGGGGHSAAGVPPHSLPTTQPPPTHAITPCLLMHRSQGLDNGYYQFQAQATDAAGNAGAATAPYPFQGGWASGGRGG